MARRRCETGDASYLRGRLLNTFLINLSEGAPPRLRVPLLNIKEAILGRRYRLSVAFLPPRRMRVYNRRYRGKDEPTDILSFPLGPLSGEILLSPAEARRRARPFCRRGEDFILFLFIHGLLHLKGMRHGSKMEREERTFRKRFGI